MVRQLRLNLPISIPLHFVPVHKMASEGQSDKMMSDMEMQMKQRCVTEFLHAEKNAPIDIHQCLQNVYGEQIVDVNTLR